MKKVYSIALCLLISLLLTLTACGQTGVTITVSFQVEGAQYHSTSTAQGKMPTMPTDPSKEGYAFDAWYYDDGIWEKPMTAQSFLDLPITENMTVTVYAHFTENEPEPQGMNFEEAIAAYKSRTSFYITFDATINGITANDIEWYEDSDTLIVKTIAVIGEPAVTWYIDKAANKTYRVDTAQQRLIPADTGMVNLVPPISGSGTDGTITIESKTYPCKDFVIEADVTARFVNDRNKLFAIVFTGATVTQTRIYSDVFISKAIPTTSDLYGVADYEKSNWIAMTVLSESMSPTLVMGETYYFEPVDVST
ncbi:MAG: InlB B-repeat-containing protein, partial [Clostridia bacterium]|nr:InlB B-repeat-containing protein [Clostridia bacterium]